MSQSVLAETTRVLDRYRGSLTQVAAGLTAVAEACLHPILILPLILTAAALPGTAIGVMVAVATAGWALAQLVADPGGWPGLPANWRSWLVGVRALLALGLAVALSGLGQPGGLTALLLLVLAGFWAMGGLLSAGRLVSSYVAADDNTVLEDRDRFWRGVALTAVGIVLVQWLGPNGLAFPAWAILLGAIATIMLLLAAGLLWRAEPGDPDPNGAVWPHVFLMPALLAHGRRLRRYTFFRLLVALSSLADPFYLIYGLLVLDLPWQSAGLYIGLFGLVRLGAGLIYPTLIADGYARLLAQVASLMRVLCPMLLLALPLILRSLLATRPEMGMLGPLAFGGIIALLGLATACTEAADQAYFRDALAPVHRLVTRGLLLVVLVIGSVAYLVGGAITSQFSFEALLMVAFVGGMLTLFASGILLAVPPAETRDLTATGALPTYRDSSDW